MIARLGIVTPVLDDWDSLRILVAAVATALADSRVQVDVLAVDDGSLDSFDPGELALTPSGVERSVQVLRLAANLGHQRAIAVGLTEMTGREDLDAVVVIDSDGEDRPEDITRLLDVARSEPGLIVMAQRAKRSESLTFRVAYQLYKLMFRSLTGRVIDFGNFSLLPMRAVRRLVHMPELWNNLAAAILRCRLPYRAIPTERGHRYAGSSRMNLPALVIHGLSAMSVYTDVIFVRILAGAVAFAFLSLLGMATVVLLRLFTDLWTPGWATTVVANLAVMMMLTVIMVIAGALMQLAGRSTRQVIPVVDAEAFIEGRITGAAGEGWCPTRSSPRPAARAGGRSSCCGFPDPGQGRCWPPWPGRCRRRAGPFCVPCAMPPERNWTGRWCCGSRDRAAIPGRTRRRFMSMVASRWSRLCPTRWLPPGRGRRRRGSSQGAPS